MPFISPRRHFYAESISLFCAGNGAISLQWRIAAAGRRLPLIIFTIPPRNLFNGMTRILDRVCRDARRVVLLIRLIIFRLPRDAFTLTSHEFYFSTALSCHYHLREMPSIAAIYADFD